MTTLQLDIPQRMNIIAMLDTLECHGRREAWAVCRLQEQLSLTDYERDAVNWQKVVQADGREYQIWQLNATAREIADYKISDDDLTRVCRAVDQFRMVPGRDRMWYEPLVKQLPPPPEAPAPPQSQSVNGAASAIQ